MMRKPLRGFETKCLDIERGFNKGFERILLERGFSQFIVERLGFREDGRTKDTSQ